VLCVNDLPPGGSSGAEVHLSLLVSGLQSGGDEVRCFSLPPRTGLGRLADVWSRSARRELDAQVAAFRPDVLHFHNVVRELSVAVLTAAPALPRVMTVHDGRLLGDADAQGWVLRGWQQLRSTWERRLARARAGRLLAVSGPLRARLLAAGFPDVVHAWPWAAQPVARVVPPASSLDVVFLGRLDRDKGVDLLVTAFLQADVLGARLLLAGTGAYVPPAHPQVVALGSLDRTDVSALLGSARVVALPSLPARRPEGAPLALIEALVHGRPLLVSDDPGCAEVARICSPTPAGLAVPAGDVAALATALRQLLTDDALVERLAAGAVLAAAEHTAEAGLARVRTAYAAALGRVAP
jgi:glycosyltransferase involved in cell wall biosynthesis